MCRECERLRDRVEELEALVKDLRFEGVRLGPVPLSPAETRIVAILAKRSPRVLAKETLREQSKSHILHEPHEKSLDVHICKARRKLKPFGVEIHNSYAFGFYMDKESKKRLDDLMQCD